MVSKQMTAIPMKPKVKYRVATVDMPADAYMALLNDLKDIAGSVYAVSLTEQGTDISRDLQHEAHRLQDLHNKLLMSYKAQR
jgi:hypothetical protein